MSNAVQTAVAAYLSGRNRIINGNALINQRQAVGTPVAGTFQYGGPDHFAAIIGSTTGGAYTQNQPSVADVNGTRKFWVKQTVGTIVPDLSGVKYWSGISQPVEANLIYDLIGNPNGLNLSFQFLATLAGRYSIALFDSTFSYSYVKSFNYAVGGTPQAFSFPIPAIPVGITLAAGASGYLMVRIGGLNAGSWQCPVINEGAWNSTVYYNGLGVTNWAATVGNYISATDIQLEPGQIATPFEYKPFGEHLRDCQRYYWNTYVYGTAPGTAAQDGSSLAYFTGGAAVANNYLGGPVKHPVKMRVAPTATYWNPHNAATVGSAWAQNAAASLNAFTASASDEFITIALNNQATIAGDFVKFHFAATAEF